MKTYFKTIRPKKIQTKVSRLLGLLLVALLLCSHDLYLKMETYLLQPNQEATLNLYNGTFEKSENVITRDRMLDASVVAQGARTQISSSDWTDQDSTITQFTFTTGEPGTYVAGVSTKPRNIELTADKFNDYLKHDGILDMLAYRTENNIMDKDAVESYQKHVKAIYQVGDIKTDDWKSVLGYPIEFVPQSNPYESYSGGKLDMLLLLDGQPLTNQLVYADYRSSQNQHTHEHNNHSHDHDAENHQHEHSHNNNVTSHSHDHDAENHSHEHSHNANDSSHSHDHDATDHSHGHSHADTTSDHHHDHNKQDQGHSHNNHEHGHTHKDGAHNHNHQSEQPDHHTHTSGQKLRTNDQGLVTIDLPEDGIYYIRTIHMVTVDDHEELTHQSKWATLTFEVTHQHGENTHTHDDHDHESEIPTWAFVVGSVLIIGLFFFLFRKKA